MTEKSFVADSVVVQFNVEEAIVSDTVKATLVVTKVVSDDQRFDLRGLLRTLVDTDWEIHSVKRADDNGFERITAIASARIPDSDAATIHRKARDVSKAGLKVEVNELDYSPERNRIDAAKQKLRQSVYSLAQQETEKLNELMVHVAAPWRVGSVDFSRNDVWTPPGTRAAAYETVALAVAAPAGGSADDSTLDTAYKVGLTATVRLTRSVVV
jgi:hypothetical protein